MRVRGKLPVRSPAVHNPAIKLIFRDDDGTEGGSVTGHGSQLLSEGS